MSIRVRPDPRHHGCYVAVDGDLVYNVSTNATGRVVPTGDDTDPIPPDVADAVLTHIDPRYVAPDYLAISSSP